MLTTRVIPCLDVDRGQVVKGIEFKGIQPVGDPVERARYYNDEGADELIFLDIGASYRSRKIMIHVVRQVSQEVFIPLTVGGGIQSVKDMRAVLNAGADKVALCTSALQDPSLLSQGAHAFGSQCIVLSIDAKSQGTGWHAYTHGGRIDTGQDAVKWAREGEQRGAGEILLNSMDADGTRRGYDLPLTRSVSDTVGIPVIASGGAGNLQQVLEAVKTGHADAVLLASLLHYNEYRISDIKAYLHDHGVLVR